MKIKDKRNLIIVIVAIVSFAVLAIMYISIIFVLPDIVFYCPDANEDIILYAGCLLKYPEKYDDKFVKVVGSYSSGSEIWTIESRSGEYNINIKGYIKGASANFGLTAAYLPFSIVDNSNNTIPLKNNEYYWYGIFRYTDLVKSSGGSYMVNGMYLEVLKFEKK